MSVRLIGVRYEPRPSGSGPIRAQNPLADARGSLRTPHANSENALTPDRLVRGSTLRAFTLIELLIVVAIIGLLLSLMLPALGSARNAARTVICGSNLRQMMLALQQYTDDHDGFVFPFREDLPNGKLWWYGFESSSSPTTEGQRVLDRSRSRLWPYYAVADSIEVCPSFPVHSSHYKPKYTTNWTTYGLPMRFITPATLLRTDRITEPWRTLALADTAQINAFQAPASPSNPMFEQWFYITASSQSVHYVHQHRASAAMFDGHVELIDPEFGVNPTFPEAPIGRPPSTVVLRVQ